FFVMSGFFSAMLLHRRGRGALVKHRFQRVFLPLLVGLFTIVPLTFGVSTLAMMYAPRKTGGATTGGGAANIWEAAKAGDVASIERHLANGVKVDAEDSLAGGTPLAWAAVGGREKAIELLIKHGANVNAAGRDGGTALHGAAFLGH